MSPELAAKAFALNLTDSGGAWIGVLRIGVERQELGVVARDAGMQLQSSRMSS